MDGQIDLRGEFLREFLGSLCDANQAVVFLSKMAGEGVPVRMLSCSGTQLLIDLPRIGGKVVATIRGEEVRIRGALEVGLLEFGAVARGRWHVAGPGSAPCLALSAPEKAVVIQRRAAFRVTLLEAHATARLWPLDRASWEVRAEVVNASAIGAAMTIGGRDADKLRVDEVCRFSFDPVEGLPDLHVVGRIVRQAPARGGSKTLIGVAWRLDESKRTDRLLEDQMAKFIAARQRPGLRRRSYRLPGA